MHELVTLKSAGVALAAIAIWIQRRRAKACAVDARPRLWKTLAVVLGVGVGTYTALYALTTWLGNLSG